MRTQPPSELAGGEGSGSSPDPIALFCRAGERERFLWLAPDRGRALLALGARARVEARGEGRFASAAESAAALWRQAAGGGAPRLLAGGFSFAPGAASDPEWHAFPDLHFALPERLLEIDGAQARWHGDEARGEPGPAPARAARRAAEAGDSITLECDDPAAYVSRVGEALGSIARGELEKVVLARRVRVTRRGGFEIEPLLRTLAGRHPSCILFAIARGDSLFLGASPEPLVRLRRGSVETAALAGSAPRGRSPEEDRERARALLESKKEQAEHEAVVRALREALSPVCSELRAPEAPELRRLDGIQHLETPIRGRLSRPLSILELAARLHPTPSVAGSPGAAARDWLARREGLARGWYAGGVGWLDARGDGELCVALRCALIRGDEAHLYAGAGIVAGSDPEAELQETRTKLRSLLDPLLEI